MSHSLSVPLPLLSLATVSKPPASVPSTLCLYAPQPLWPLWPLHFFVSMLFGIYTIWPLCLYAFQPLCPLFCLYAVQPLCPPMSLSPFAFLFNTLCTLGLSVNLSQWLSDSLAPQPVSNSSASMPTVFSVSVPLPPWPSSSWALWCLCIYAAQLLCSWHLSVPLSLCLSASPTFSLSELLTTLSLYLYGPQFLNQSVSIQPLALPGPL